jgi:hypothetical protein
METLEEKCVRLEKEVADLKKSNTYFQEKLVFYESNGLAKLYYSLNRKMNEAAEMLNKNQLQNIDLDDKNNKAFERIVKILEASEKMATSVTSLGNLAKITGDEKKDVERKPFNDLLAEKRY